MSLPCLLRHPPTKWLNGLDGVLSRRWVQGLLFSSTLVGTWFLSSGVAHSLSA